MRASHERISPGEYLYFPAFHYTSYTNMTLEDALTIKAYLFSLVPVAQGDATPNITPDEETGLGRWSAEELADYLETGMKSDGDFADASMAEIIDHPTGKLSAGDRAAIARYLRSVPAIRRWKSPSR